MSDVTIGDSMAFGLIDFMVQQGVAGFGVLGHFRIMVHVLDRPGDLLHMGHALVLFFFRHGMCMAFGTGGRFESQMALSEAQRNCMLCMTI